MRHRNKHVWDQIMNQRIKRILADNRKHPEHCLNLKDYFATSSKTTESSGSLTLQSLQKLMDTVFNHENEAQVFTHELLMHGLTSGVEIAKPTWRTGRIKL